MAAADRVLLIQLIHQNSGALSKAKRQAHFADLTDQAIAEAAQVVRGAFAPP